MGRGGGGGCCLSRSRAAIKSLPSAQFLRAESAAARASAVSRDCAVCLLEFTDGDELRALPMCAHAFHADCIDVWLRAHASCPLCPAAVALPAPVASPQLRSTRRAGRPRPAASGAPPWSQPASSRFAQRPPASPSRSPAVAHPHPQEEPDSSCPSASPPSPRPSSSWGDGAATHPAGSGAGIPRRCSRRTTSTLNAKQRKPPAAVGDSTAAGEVT